MGKVYNAKISILLVAVLVGIPIACSRKPSDDVIAKDIQTKVAANPETKDSEVTVAAKDGKVTVAGKVKTPAARQKVEQIAREEPGVAAVDDQTAIPPETASASQPPFETAQPTSPAPVAPPPPVEKPKPQPIIVPAGTTFVVRTSTVLGSKTSQTGQTFLATLAQPVSVGGTAAIPAGATVSGTVVEAKAKGKIKGEAVLNLALTSITVKGHTYPIETAVVQNTVKGKGKRTAATTGGGAAGGALIGGLAGGGKGAGIGALVGAGAGLAGGALTGNTQIELPAESAISFRLAAPLTLRPAGV